MLSMLASIFFSLYHVSQLSPLLGGVSGFSVVLLVDLFVDPILHLSDTPLLANHFAVMPS